MPRRILIALTLLASPGALFAQNDFAVWINSTRFKSSDLATDIPRGTGTLKFGQKMGYGVSYSHFSGPNVSTEFARANDSSNSASSGFLNSAPAAIGWPSG